MFLGAYVWWRNTHIPSPVFLRGSTAAGVSSNLLAPTLARLRRGVAEGWAAEKILFVSDRGVAPGEPQRHVWMMNPDGTAQEQVTFGDVNDSSPAVSPDGTLVAFSRAVSPRDVNHSCLSVWVKDLITGVETSITRHYDFPSSAYVSAKPAWSPDGTKIAFHRNPVEPDCGGGPPESASIWVVDYQPVVGPPRQLTTESSMWAAWSPDGNHLMYMREVGPDGMTAINRIELERGIEEEVIPFIRRGVAGCVGADYFPTYSPDGLKIAWIAYRHTRRGDVYVADSAHPLNTQRRVTPPSPVQWFYPAWSPDGSKLAFHSQIDQPEWPHPDRRGVAQHIWTSNVDGSGLTQLTSGPVLDSHPSWAIVVSPHADLAITNTGSASEVVPRSKISHTITVRFPEDRRCRGRRGK
jgi:Tol biopolymer transport system component